MRRLINYLLMSWLVFCTACGYRTAPVPYDLPDESIQTITDARLNIQGDNWVFRWKIPEGQPVTTPSGKEKPPIADSTSDIAQVKESPISIFRINILKATGICPLCEPENSGHFLIDLNTATIEPVFPEGIKLPLQQQFFITGEQDFRLNLPIAFFRANGLIEHCFYTIDYFLTSGLLSVPSQKLYPPDLKTIPVPTVRVRKWVNDIQTPQRVQAIAEPSATDPPLAPLPVSEKKKSDMIEMPRLSVFLTLEWELQQETLRHTLQKDRRFNEEVVYYGMNFYQRHQKSNLIGTEVKNHETFQISENLINPEPLLYGSFSLMNFQGELLARHVDRFGNESESISVFKEQYRPPIEKNQ